MKSGGHSVGKVGGKPQVASKAVPTIKALRAEIKMYGKIKRELLKNRQNISNLKHGIKTGIFPLKTAAARSFAKTYSKKYGFTLVMRGNQPAGLKYYIKGKHVAPQKNLLGGPGAQAQVGKQRFMPLYKQMPLAVRSAFSKLSRSKTKVMFFSVRAANRLVKSAGELAVLMDAAGYRLLRPHVLMKLKTVAMQQKKLQFNVSVQKGRAAMLEGDPGALKRANDKLTKFKASYGDPLALYNYAKANGGLFVESW